MTTKTSTSRLSKAKLVKPLLGLGLVVLLGAGLYFFLPGLLGSSRGEMPLTRAVVRDDLRVTILERGELECIDNQYVINEVSGAKLVSILPEGTQVKKGDVVAEMDTDTLTKDLNIQRVALQAAEGKVLAAKSDLIQAQSKQGTENATAEKTFKLAELALKAYKAPKGEFEKEQQKLKGALELARKELVEAQEDLKFTMQQLKKGFGELTAMKSKEIGVQQRTFQVSSAEAELTLLEQYTKEQKITELEFNAENAKRELERTKEAQRSAVEKAESELKTAESTAAIEKEKLKLIEKQIERCKLVSPGEGVVVYANMRYYGETGQIRPGSTLMYQQPIFSLPDFNKLQVKVKIHEAQVKKLRKGQKADLKLEALTNRPLKGTLDTVGMIATTDGFWGSRIKVYECIVLLDEIPTDAGIKPGMSAEVNLLVKTVPDALLVPVSAVAEFDGQRVVYTVSGKQITRKVVQTGDESDEYVQILEGVAEGEEVALDARNRAAADLKSANGG